MTASSLIYQSLTTRSGRVGYVHSGDGPPLILLVGYSGNLLHWNRRLIYQLAESFSVYLLDNRYIGLSHSQNPSTMAGLAQDCLDFMDALGLTKVYVLGWSLGGYDCPSISVLS